MFRIRTLMLASLTATALCMPVAAWADDAPPTCDGAVATIVGTDGDDTLNGTTGADVIVGLGGNDTIGGNLGDDVICGGTGADTLSGHGDDDRIFGQQGEDWLDGGIGGCCPSGPNTGDDWLSGGQDDDVLHASDLPILGNTMHGDQGDDELYAWSGGRAYGDNGDDQLFQYSIQPTVTGTTLDGGNGDDELTDWDDGGFANESIRRVGGRGDDELISLDATSTSTLDGGQGADGCSGGDTTTACE